MSPDERIRYECGLRYRELRRLASRIGDGDPTSAERDRIEALQEEIRHLKAGRRSDGQEWAGG
jgi:hypothetical protein